MHHFQVNPRRCYRGKITQAAVAANFSICSLLNQGGGDQYIAVLDWFVLSGANAAQADAGVRTGTPIGSVGGTITPIWSSLGSGPGALYAGTNGTELVGDYFSGASVQGNWLHNYPFAILRPGEQFFISAQSNNSARTLNIFWQVITALELKGSGDPDSP